MAETMTALVERDRAFKAAYAAADFDAGPSEDEMLASPEAKAGRTIEADPPCLRDKADLVAAIRYVADDVDFLQVGHGRVLARALEYLTTSTADPTSLHVNALFGTYVEIEREQNRLADAGRGSDAASLGSKALAIRDEVFAIRNRTGCADLVAARVLLDLMLAVHWNAEGGPVIGEEDRETALPVLEILADRLTGEVRRQAALALSTIGVSIDAGPDDEARGSDETAETAALEFEPWEGTPEPMSPTAWASWLPTLRLCHATMHKPKANLVAMFKEGPDTAEAAFTYIDRFASFLGDMRALALDAASRLTIASCVVAIETSGDGDGLGDVERREA